MDIQRVPVITQFCYCKNKKTPMIICKCEKDGRKMDLPNEKEKEAVTIIRIDNLQ